MGDTDPLFELRNLFLIGNYQSAINEGLTLDHLPEAHKVDRDVIIYRAYIAKGDYNLVLEEIKDSSPHAGLVAVKALASYLSSERNKDIVLTTIKSWPSDPRMVNNDTVQLVSGLIAFYEENYDEVFRTLHQSTSLEGYGALSPLPFCALCAVE
jgi:coatomer protein complex subunit epsilon